ncbi:MAG: hypothetical protein NTW86_23920 [Candidatus Sumerlaeota bacterium]|nr:hypothetical protein [Candidatus Sumerlaeota bacterium]
MNHRLAISFIAFCLLAAVLRAGAGEVLIDSFDSQKDWSTVSEAKVSIEEAGHTGPCLRVEFGAPGQPKAGLIQGPVPESAEAWAKRGEFAPDGFAFWAKADTGFKLTVNLRVRKIGVTGPQGVVGQAHADVKLEKGDWRRYEIPFSAFQADADLGMAVGPDLFEKFHPQVQFKPATSVKTGKVLTVSIDDLAFAAMSEKAKAAVAKPAEEGEVTMKWPGLELASEAAKASAALPAIEWKAPERANAPGMEAAAPDGARERLSLLKGWAILPVNETTGALGEAQSIDLPGRWPGSRDYKAAWQVARVQLPAKDAQRLVVHFEMVKLFCVLFVNGKECGRHLGSYTPFDIDITDAAVEGPNTLALFIYDEYGAIQGNKAFNQLGGRHLDRFRANGGVYDIVYLERREPARVADVFVKTSTRKQSMQLVCELTNDGAEAQAGRLELSVVEWPKGRAVDLAIPTREVQLAAGKTETVTVDVPWKDPRLWSPEHPNLYVMRTTLKTGAGMDTLSTRFGFREFWVEGKQFMLNGQPIRLRGESNFRLRDMPQGIYREFERDAMRVYKDVLGVNAFRVHAAIGPRATFEGADEAGILLIDQSSVWSSMGQAYRNGGQPFLDNLRGEFAEWVRRDRNSPSVAIWDTENEQIRSNKSATPWAMKFDDFVRPWDDTRPIEHSGAGWYDKSQDTIHLHMQEHYSWVLDQWRRRGQRPIVMGEFWIGGRGETRLTSSKEFHSQLEYFEEDARLYEMYMLEMRYYGASAVMPFTASRTLWVNPSEGRQIWDWRPGSKPANVAIRSPLTAQRIRHGLEPATVFFWPRVEADAAGGEAKRELVVCNDTEEAKDFQVEWGEPGGNMQTQTIHLNPAEQWKATVDEPVPAAKSALVARLLDKGKEISSDTLGLRPVPPDRLKAPALQRKVEVYEGGTKGTVDALRQVGLTVEAAPGMPQTSPDKSLWVIAPNASDPTLNGQAKAIREYLEKGGRILCLAQETWPRWSPVRLEFWPSARAMVDEFKDFGWPEGNKFLYFARHAPIYAPTHPAFAGIANEDLRWWSSFDGRVSDDALVRPAAVGGRSQGAWRVLAGGSRLENASLAEARVGAGLLVFCQAHALQEAQNPEARALLFNLLRYLDGAAWPADMNRIRLAGDLDAGKLAAQTGVPADALKNGKPENGGVLIAGDGASSDELAKWAEAGGTVLVLSAETAKRLPGYAVERNEQDDYAGARGTEDDPLLWGVSSTSFTDFKNTCVAGELTTYPKDARILLYGLKGPSRSARMTNVDIGFKGLVTMDHCGPVAVAQKKGKGEWIVTTMEPWRARSVGASACSVYDAELMSTLLANAGAPIELPSAAQSRARVLKTVPIQLDGKLDDWTNDIEDRNVSPYRHAEPIVLSSENAVAGAPSGDADFSGIAYFLWDDSALYAAGALLGKVEGQKVEIRLGDRTLNIEWAGQHPKAQLASPQGEAVKVQAAGAQLKDAKELTDTRSLSFTMIDRRVGHLKTVDRVGGETFEAKIPWSSLGLSAPPQETRVLVRLSRADGVALQAPREANEGDPATWLTLTLAP